MADDGWRTVRFQDLIDGKLLEIGDGYRAKNSELGGDGPIFLRAGQVSDSHVSFEGVERFHARLADSLQPKMSKAGDTMVTTKGNSTGRTSFVASWMPPFVYSPHLSYWRSLEENDIAPGFLRYWSKGPEFAAQLHGMMESTDMAPYLSLTDQRRLRVTLPPPIVQNAIARVLVTLDDKIELNRRMNHTLDALARGVFRSWFVDFDPVVAKAAGRKCVGMSEETARFFPDSFEDSPLGPIPKGWGIGKLRDIAGINRHSIKNGYPHRVIEYIDISSVSVGRLDSTSRYELEKAPSRAQRLISHGDTLWSCVRPNRKSYLFVHHPEPNTVASTGFAVLSSSCSAPCFLHLWVTTDEFVDYLTAHAEGSAYPAVRPEAFANADVLIPLSPVLGIFEQQVGPLYERNARNEQQSRTLARLRDALLPKLLSGELRVKEAETMLETA
jgi:type I restriction enzyme S subunit